MCSHLDYLGKLVDDFSNTDHRSIGKKNILPVIIGEKNLLMLTIGTAPKFKVGDTVRITIIKGNNIFNVGYTDICSREMFFIDPVIKKIFERVKLRLGTDKK